MSRGARTGREKFLRAVSLLVFLVAYSRVYRFEFQTCAYDRAEVGTAVSFSKRLLAHGEYDLERYFFAFNKLPNVFNRYRFFATPNGPTVGRRCEIISTVRGDRSYPHALSIVSPVVCITRSVHLPVGVLDNTATALCARHTQYTPSKKREFFVLHNTVTASFIIL